MMTEKKCQIDGCDRKIAVLKHGLCKAHANRFYWKGTPGEGGILPRKRHEPFKASSQNDPAEASSN